MKEIIISILIVSFLFAACEQERGLKSENQGCKAYTELYFNNYDRLKRDPINVDTIYVDGDCLRMKVNYGGCTTDHPIDLAYIFPECGTPPLPPPSFEIRHDSRGELCKMLVTKELSFNLIPLQTVGKGEVVFWVHWNNNSNEVASIPLTYTY